MITEITKIYKIQNSYIGKENVHEIHIDLCPSAASKDIK